MTLFFPDLNVWVALSDAAHTHNSDAWEWMNAQGREARLLFSRYTQIGLLRLLTSPAVMGDQRLTLRKAWAVYDHWQNDPRVEFHPEPRAMDSVFRRATEPFAAVPASKAIGDCYLLAFAIQSQATLVTFDAALYALARKHGHSAVIPA